MSEADKKRTTRAAAPHAGSSPGAASRRYLTVRLADTLFGFDIDDIVEVAPMMSVVRVPETPASTRGLIEHRGEFIPVVDLRHRLQLPPRADDERTCLVVVDSEPSRCGLVVDTVHGLQTITRQDVGSPPAVMAGAPWLEAITSTDDGTVLIVDVHRLLGAHEPLVTSALPDRPARSA